MEEFDYGWELAMNLAEKYYEHAIQTAWDLEDTGYFTEAEEKDGFFTRILNALKDFIARMKKMVKDKFEELKKKYNLKMIEKLLKTKDYRNGFQVTNYADAQNICRILKSGVSKAMIATQKIQKTTGDKIKEKLGSSSNSRREKELKKVMDILNQTEAGVKACGSKTVTFGPELSILYKDIRMSELNLIEQLESEKIGIAKGLYNTGDAWYDAALKKIVTKIGSLCTTASKLIAGNPAKLMAKLKTLSK